MREIHTGRVRVVACRSRAFEVKAACLQTHNTCKSASKRHFYSISIPCKFIDVVMYALNSLWLRYVLSLLPSVYALTVKGKGAPESAISYRNLAGANSAISSVVALP